MLKEIIFFLLFQLLTFQAFASDQTIAQKQSASKSGAIEKLKAHIPVVDVQKIIMEYVENEYKAVQLDQVARITATAQSQNGIYMMITSSDDKNKIYTAKIWKFENGNYVHKHSLNLPIMVEKAAISDDGKNIAIREKNGNQILIGQIKHSDLIEYQVEKVDGYTELLQFFGKDNFLGQAKFADRVTIWHRSKENKFLPLQDFGPSSLAAFSNDGHYIATGLSGGPIDLWKMLNNEFTLVNQFKFSPLRQLAISPDNKYLAAGSEWDTVILKIQNDTLKPMQTIQIAASKSIKFSADGTHLGLVTYGEKDLPIINVLKFNKKSQKYEHIATLPHGYFYNDPYHLIGFAPNNSIITATMGNEITMWENLKEQLEQDTGEKSKTTIEQEKVSEVD